MLFQLVSYIITQVVKFSFIKNIFEDPSVYNVLGLSLISVIDGIIDINADKIIAKRSGDMFAQVSKKILFGNMDFYKNDISSKITNIMTCLHDIKDVSRNLIINIPQSVAYIIFYSYYTYYYSIYALYIVYVTNLMVFICSCYGNPKNNGNNETILKNKILEIMLNIEHVKLHNKESYEYMNIISLFKEHSRAHTNIGKYVSILNGMGLLFTQYISNNNNYSLFIVIGAIYFNSCVHDLALNYIFFNKTLNELHFIKKILQQTNTNDTINYVRNTQDINNNACIEFNNVTFSYGYGHNEVPVINNLSFIFYKNKLNLLLGPNGSGKTTIVHILMRLYENKSLDVKLYGKNIYDIDLNELRKTISFVSYEPYLFDNTIWYNIRYGNHEVSDEYIMNICKDFGVLDLINLNRDKNIGFRGKYLSAGEKKIVQLLNCICSKAEILIFDEPTNTLDNNAMKRFNEFIHVLKSQYHKTIVIITHDLRMVDIADHIVEL